MLFQPLSFHIARIFMSNFWQHMFHLVGTKTTASTAYHPQIDVPSLHYLFLSKRLVLLVILGWAMVQFSPSFSSRMFPIQGILHNWFQYGHPSPLFCIIYWWLGWGIFPTSISSSDFSQGTSQGCTKQNEVLRLQTSFSMGVSGGGTCFT